MLDFGAGLRFEFSSLICLDYLGFIGFSESKVVSLRSACLDYSGYPLGLKLDKAEVRPQISGM